MFDIKPWKTNRDIRYYSNDMSIVTKHFHSRSEIAFMYQLINSH